MQYIPAVPMSSYLTTKRSRVSVPLYPHFTREQAETCFHGIHRLQLEQLLLTHAAAINPSPGGPTGKIAQSCLAIREVCTCRSHYLRHLVCHPDPRTSTYCDISATCACLLYYLFCWRPPLGPIHIQAFPCLVEPSGVSDPHICDLHNSTYIKIK